MAAALLSVHSFHVAFSQEARGYSLLVLPADTGELRSGQSHRIGSGDVALDSVRLQCCALRLRPYFRPSGAGRARAGDSFSASFPGASSRPWQSRLLRFGFLVAPMAAFVLLHHSDQIDWVPKPGLGEVAEFLTLLTGRGGVLLGVIYFALCGVAFWHSRGASGSGKEKWALRLLGLWLVLPPVLTLMASIIKPIFFPRYMVMCVPALVLLAARGIVRLSRLAGG